MYPRGYMYPQGYMYPWGYMYPRGYMFPRGYMYPWGYMRPLKEGIGGILTSLEISDLQRIFKKIIFFYFLIIPRSVM